jgi:hypothetical protein
MQNPLISGIVVFLILLAGAFSGWDDETTPAIMSAKPIADIRRPPGTLWPAQEFGEQQSYSS